jgi:outer membrane autotransporter protein
LTKLGTGTLTLSGENNYSGGTTVEEGQLVVASTAALGDGGMAMNGGDLSTGNGNHVINVEKDYSQSAGATLSLGIGGTALSEFDHMLVGGTVSLGGTLQLTSLNSFTPTIGNDFTLIASGGTLTGQFSNVIDPYEDERLYPVYLSQEVVLETMPSSFTSLALTPNQKSVAAALDSIYGNGSQAVTALLAGLGTLSEGQYPHAYDLISPSNMASLYTVNFRIANLQASALGSRMASFLAGQNGFGGNSPTASIDSNTMFAGTLPAEVELEMARHSSHINDEGVWGGFFDGGGGSLSVNGDGNGEGYNATFSGLTAAGVDYQVNHDLAFGLLLGYQGANVSANGGSHMAIAGGQAGLYGLVKSSGFFAQFLGAGGYNTYNSQRVAYGGTASGNTNGEQYTGQVGLGYQFQAGDWTLGPIGSLQYTKVDINGFQETGSLSPESFGNQGQDSLMSNLGAQLAADLPLNRNATLVPVVNATWLKEYDNQGGVIDSSVGGTPFTVQGSQIGQDGIQVGAGLGLQFRDGLNLSVQYQGDFAQTNFSSQAFGGEIHFNL